MEQLNKSIDRSLLQKNSIQDFDHLPEKIIQFGEGNFLRGFVDWMVQQLNNKGLFNGRIVAIQPTPHGKVVPKLNAQDGLYTTVLRGIENGSVIDKAEIISSISRGINPYSDWHEVLKVAESKDIQFVFSNTTEAGLTYLKEDFNKKESPLSFPGKVVAFLYHRFQVMNGDPKAGLTIIPCELVEDNGNVLKDIVNRIASEWQLPADFIQWVNEHNRFCNSLVDRIVTGFPKDSINEFYSKLGYEDILLTVGEPYHMFAIDADEEVAEQLPFHKAGLNVKWGDVTPYREIKVRLLNGPHTMMFAVSYLSGADTVLEAMEDEVLSTFIKNGLYDEILPVVKMEDAEKRSFVESVVERFLNPYNKHFLVDIGLNAVYKFKTRLIPTLFDYNNANQRLPQSIVFSLAALIVYYRPARKEGAFLVGNRGEVEYSIRDNEGETFLKVWEQYGGSNESVEALVNEVLSNVELWGLDLTTINDLKDTVVTHINNILQQGMKTSVSQLSEKVNG